MRTQRPRVRVLPEPPAIETQATDEGVLLSDDDHELLVPWRHAGDVAGRMTGLLLAQRIKEAAEATLRGDPEPPTTT